MRLAAFIAALAALCCCAAAASATPPPPVTGRAYVVVNAGNGAILAARHARAPVPIASITKLMTVLVALEHHKLTDTVTVDGRARAGGSSIGLRGGERMTVRDLVKGALIQSANDAADALALSVSPDFPSFAALMNAKAKQLGLTKTHFVRPDGLDAPGHLSSALDVTTLARAAMRIRFVRETVRERTDTISGGRTLHTWNDLLGTFPNVIGVKTGHTSNAGWSQVAAVRGRGVTIYATLLGSPSRSVRNGDLKELLAWGVAQYRVVSAIRSDRVYARARLPYGKGMLALHADKPYQAVVRVEQPLRQKVIAATGVKLPVDEGDVLGRVEIWQGRRLMVRRDLVASRTVNRPSLPGRIRWYAGRTARNLWGMFT